MAEPRRTTISGGEVPASSPIVLDATLSAERTRSAQVTKHPVEDGAPVSDHILFEPLVLKLEGGFTDDPIGEDPQPGRARALFDALERLHLAGAVLTVSTRLRTYDRMVIASISSPDTSKSGSAVRFSAVLQDVRTVKTQAVPILTRAVGTRPKVNGGKKVADKTAAPPAKKVSVLKGWLNQLGAGTPGVGVAPP